NRTVLDLHNGLAARDPVAQFHVDGLDAPADTRHDVDRGFADKVADHGDVVGDLASADRPQVDRHRNHASPTAGGTRGVPRRRGGLTRFGLEVPDAAAEYDDGCHACKNLL